MKDNKLKKLFSNQLFATIIALLLGFVVAGLILLGLGTNPVEAYTNMFAGVFGNPRNFAETIIKATPIIITGASIAFAFKTGLFNIGAEGQYIVGLLAAGIVGILVDFHPIIQIPLLLVSGMVAGMLFGGLSGILKSKFGVHEVISGIMLNWIAFYLQMYVALGSPLFIQETSGTAAINVSGQLKLFAAEKAAGDYAALVDVPIIGKILGRSDINYGIIISLIVVFVLQFIIKKTTLGYQLRAVGYNKDAAEFAGINVNKNIIRSMAIAGAVAGLAGAINIMALSPNKINSIAMFENYGFDGLSVALMAGSSIPGVVLASLLFSSLKIGGNIIQLNTGAPSELISVLIGTIVFFIALANILPVIADKIAGRKAKAKAREEAKKLKKAEEIKDRTNVIPDDNLLRKDEVKNNFEEDDIITTEITDEDSNIDLIDEENDIINEQNDVIDEQDDVIDEQNDVVNEQNDVIDEQDIVLEEEKNPGQDQQRDENLHEGEVVDGELVDDNIYEDKIINNEDLTENDVNKEERE